MNESQLRAIMPFAGSKAAIFLPFINATFVEFLMNTPLRQAAFLAQIAHESGQLRYVEELASGIAYEGREDLGNTEPGDGKRYKGRGLIQVTGRANYAACGNALGLNLIEEPTLLAEPINAVRSAGWFWNSRGLNKYADSEDFDRITRRINGGTNGLAERVRFYNTAKTVLGVT